METHLLLALQFHLETSALKILKSSIISISFSRSLFTLIIVPETFKFRGAPVFDLRL